METYKRAETSLVDARPSWNSLFKHQKTFGSCDDGALAEGYSDAVVSNFAHRWDQFPEFVVLSKRHPAFRQWAIQHIDATAVDEDLRKILFNAGACIDDVKTRGLCRSIYQAAVAALRSGD